MPGFRSGDSYRNPKATHVVDAGPGNDRVVVNDEPCGVIRYGKAPALSLFDRRDIVTGCETKAERIA